MTTLDWFRMKDSRATRLRVKRLLLFQAALSEKSLEKLGHLASYELLC